MHATCRARVRTHCSVHAATAAAYTFLGPPPPPRGCYQSTEARPGKRTACVFPMRHATALALTATTSGTALCLRQQPARYEHQQRRGCQWRPGQYRHTKIPCKSASDHADSSLAETGSQVDPNSSAAAAFSRRDNERYKASATLRRLSRTRQWKAALEVLDGERGAHLHFARRSTTQCCWRAFLLHSNDGPDTL